MPDAFVVGAVRSPVGRRNGSLAAIHPADLGRTCCVSWSSGPASTPARSTTSLWGCVGQMGPQASNIGRTTVLSAGFPEKVPAATIDRQCGSSQQALHFAAQAVLAGVHDLVVAGGVEVMSQVPIGSPTTSGSSTAWRTRAAGTAGPSGTATRGSPSSGAPS
jgi:acetyl-CoA acetyltransferase